MQNWLLYQQMLRNPPTARMRDVHMLHHNQLVPMIDANSALRGNMPQRNDVEGGKTPRLSFSPASLLWGQMGRHWTTIGRGETHTTEKITESDYVAFFHQFFGFTNNPALAALANLQCPCQLYRMGGDCAWDHINSCPHHSAHWTIAHEHVLRALERICNETGFGTSSKRVLPSEGTRLADLEVRNIRVAGKRVSSATLTTRIKSSRVPLLCLPRDASMASSSAFLFLPHTPTSRQTTTLRSLDISRTKRSFATAAVSSFTATHVPVPRGGVGGGRGAQRGVSNLPPGHRVTDGFRWADRAESA
jgi:hypothetical protein